MQNQITLEAFSPAGPGSCKVTFSESGIELISDTRECKAGYLHFEGEIPTEDASLQLVAVAAKYLLANLPARDAQLGTRAPGFGGPAAAWLFKGFTPDSLSQQFGSGDKVFIA